MRVNGRKEREEVAVAMRRERKSIFFLIMKGNKSQITYTHVGLTLKMLL
jgi:hypothetical protein